MGRTRYKQGGFIMESLRNHGNIPRLSADDLAVRQLRAAYHSGNLAITGQHGMSPLRYRGDEEDYAKLISPVPELSGGSAITLER